MQDLASHICYFLSIHLEIGTALECNKSFNKGRVKIRAQQKIRFCNKYCSSTTNSSIAFFLS